MVIATNKNGQGDNEITANEGVEEGIQQQKITKKVPHKNDEGGANVFRNYDTLAIY